MFRHRRFIERFPVQRIVGLQLDLIAVKDMP